MGRTGLFWVAVAAIHHQQLLGHGRYEAALVGTVRGALRRRWYGRGRCGPERQRLRA